VDNPRPFRFGVVSGAADAAEWSALVRRAEELGYSTVFTSDHLDVSGAHVSTMSPIPALAAAAATTTTIGLGTSVLNQDLRNPAVLARDAGTLNLLSAGRLELGLGAGWNEQEYRWAGIPYDSPGTRIDRLAEYVDVLRLLFGDGEVEYHGRFFDIEGMPAWRGAPELSAPRLAIGGSGRRVLQLAATRADIVNINLVGRPDASPALLDERINWIKAAAADRPDEPERCAMVVKAVVDTAPRPQALANAMDAAERSGEAVPTAGQNLETFLDSPVVLVGSAEQIAAELLERRQRWGISYYVISFYDLEAFAPVVAQLTTSASSNA
jgi:probable F420-dependent oxidoreductase